MTPKGGRLSPRHVACQTQECGCACRSTTWEIRGVRIPVGPREFGWTRWTSMHGKGVSSPVPVPEDDRKSWTRASREANAVARGRRELLGRCGRGWLLGGLLAFDPEEFCGGIQFRQPARKWRPDEHRRPLTGQQCPLMTGETLVKLLHQTHAPNARVRRDRRCNSVRCGREVLAV